MENTTSEDCIKLIAMCVGFVIANLFYAFFFYMGWNIVAPQFNLPTFTYIEWFWIACFIKSIFK